MQTANLNTLQPSMRWYGPHDVVPLVHLKQAGCEGVVSALHAIPVGEVWSTAAIIAHRSLIEEAGMVWEVVESLPVHEDIKRRSGNCEAYLENYRQSLRNLSACGIKVVTYNFMPLLDWVRTEVSRELPNGAKALYFNHDEFAIFDLFLLQRPGAEEEYAPEEITRLRVKFQEMSEATRQRIFHNVLLGLPGSDDAFTPEIVLAELKKYEGVGEEELRSNLIHFLEAVTPTAEEVGIKMAIHPDDPPFPVLGLPRIVKTEADIAKFLDAVPSPANGLCFCTGSLGARQDNDLVAMARRFGSRVHFLHLRNTLRDEEGNFMEAEHLGGNTDMYALMKEWVALMQREGRRIPMRPDHGHQILDDLEKTTYPGYSAIGRLKGLAELRGLEYAVAQSTGS